MPPYPGDTGTLPLFDGRTGHGAWRVYRRQNCDVTGHIAIRPGVSPDFPSPFHRGGEAEQAHGLIDMLGQNERHAGGIELAGLFR